MTVLSAAVCCLALPAALSTHASPHATGGSFEFRGGSTICGATADDPAALHFGDERLGFHLLKEGLLVANLTACDGEDRAQGMVPAGAPPASLWRLNASTRAHGCGKLPGGVEMSASSRATAAKAEVAGGGSVLRLLWLGVKSDDAELTADVNVTITLTEPGTATLAASVSVTASSGGGACVTALSLPDVNRLVLRDRRDKLFVPHFFGHEGDLADVCGGGDCTVSLDHDRVMEGELGLMPNGNERSMQFMAAYSTRTSRSSSAPGARTGAAPAGSLPDPPLGVYIAAHDPRASLQQLLVEGGYDDRPGAHDSYAALKWLHFPTDLLNASGRFVVPYPVVVASLAGDWWDASQRYRAWALSEARWTRRGDLATRSAQKGYPAWLLEAPLWAQQWGPLPPPPERAPAVALREMLQLDTIGMHWYGWNTEVFDTMYPRYTPRDGFASSVAALQGSGVHVVPYTNGRLFDPHNPDWAGDGAARFACGDASGSLYGEKYESDAAHNFTFRVMDPHSEYWQAKIAGVASGIARTAHVHGVYIDQIASYYAEPCRRAADPSAPPAFGGGDAWASGESAVLERAANESGVMIISESNAEAYLGSLHGYLALYGWRSCGFVPAFQAVYGGWSVNVGMMGWNFADAVSVRAYLALQTAWGHVLGWFDAGKAVEFLSSSAADLQYARQLVALKRSNAAFLTMGRMLRPPDIVSPATAVMVRTEGHANCSVPTVAATCWQAANGSVGVVLVNHATVAANVTVNVVVDGSWGPLSASSLAGARRVAVVVSRSMPAMSAAIVPVAPHEVTAAAAAAR